MEREPKTRGNRNATWDDIDCRYLNEDKTCELASSLANSPVKTRPYACSICMSWPDGQTPLCRTVKRLAKSAGKENGVELLRTVDKRMGSGVGSELHKLIPAFLDRKGCNCKSFAKKMNVWGPDSCEKNREYIVNYLIAQSQDRAIFSWVPESATRMVINRLLTSAISRTIQQELANPTKNKWFCAVATAPRKISTLSTCLESLIIAGFEPFIFAEPKSDMVDSQFDPFMIRHKEKKGVWHNWLFSIKYALENSDANIIMTVQDDTLFHPDSKSFMEEHILWPDTKVGFVSLYTPKHYNKRPHRITTTVGWGIDAVVAVMGTDVTPVHDPLPTFDIDGITLSSFEDALLRVACCNDNGDEGTFDDGQTFTGHTRLMILTGGEVGLISLEKDTVAAGAVAALTLHTISVEGGSVDGIGFANIKLREGSRSHMMLLGVG